MGLFTELLLTPALPQNKLDLAKAQVDQVYCIILDLTRGHAQERSTLTPWQLQYEAGKHLCSG